MRSYTYGAALCSALLTAACSREAPPKSTGAQPAAQTATTDAARIDPCALLTVAEIQAATGKTVAPGESSTQGATLTCNYAEPNAMAPTVTVVVSPGMPKVSSSAAMAEWRSKQAEGYGDLTFVIAPIEGLGVPAIRNDLEGASTGTVEAAAKGRLLIVLTSSLDDSKELAGKAIPRLP